MPYRLHERGRRRRGGLPGGVFDLLNELAVVTETLEETRGSRTEHDHVDVGRSEKLRLRLHVREHMQARFWCNLLEEEPRRVERDVGRELAIELHFDRRVRRRHQQA